MLRSGYYNITVVEYSRTYAAFTTEYGLYEFLQIPIGIHIAPTYITLMINGNVKWIGLPR